LVLILLLIHLLLVISRMKQFIIFAFLADAVFSAPQFLVENKDVSEDGCHTEYTTVWEEVETEEVNKVICETEFREECFTEVDEVCKNVTEKVCRMEDEMVCVDSITNKCGLEKVLKNETYSELECTNVYKNICEYEWIGEGKNRKWVPVEGSCVTKPFEECDNIEKVRENFVEEEVCRDIPIKDCKNIPKEVCVEPSGDQQVCEEVPEEKCEIVPHEECQQITEKVPKKISKKVATIVCKENQPESEDADIELKTSIDAADVSENEISDEPEVKKQIPEVLTEESTITEVSTDHDDEEEGSGEEEQLEFDFEVEEVTSQSETTQMTVDEMTSVTTEDSVTTKQDDEVLEKTTTDEPTTPAVKVDNEPKNKKYDDSRIIFSDQAIDDRNKVLATRVFIDDGLLTQKSTVAPRRNLESDRIFFPGQDVKG